MTETVRTLLASASTTPELEKAGAQKTVLDAKARSPNADSNKLLSSHAGASPVPNNVLATIFKAWQEMHSHPCSFEKAVLGVSRRWRKVALGTPTLWTSITRKPYQKKLGRISAYLDRSKPTSFHLVISIGQPPTIRDDGFDEYDEYDESELTPLPKLDLPEFDNVSSFCKLISPHMHRCHRLELNLSQEPETGYSAGDPGSRSLKLLIKHFKSLSTPVLRSIEFTCCEDTNIRTDKILRIFTGGTPSLKSIGMRNFGLQFCLPPLSSVQSIQLHLQESDRTLCITSRELCDMLSAATSLVHLKVVGAEIVHRWAPVAKVLLPSLQTLSIGSSTERMTAREHQFCGLLNAITAPSLELLLLNSFQSRDFPSERMPISKFPHLQWLILEFGPQDYRVPDAPKETITILAKAFDSVHHLVYVNNDPKHIISATNIWPNLRTISLPRCYSRRDDETAKTLDAIWHQRAAMALPLEKIYVPLCSTDPPVEPWLGAYDKDLVYGILPMQTPNNSSTSVNSDYRVKYGRLPSESPVFDKNLSMMYRSQGDW